MGEVTSGLTEQAVRDIIAATAATSYVGGSNVVPLKLVDLLSQYPASADNLGKYARVSDLFGLVDDILRCRFDGQAYRWIPQRDSFNGTTSQASGTIPLTPLVTPPTLRLTSSTLTGNISVAPVVANAYIGQRFLTIAPSYVSTFTITLSGLIGSSIPLISGGVKEIEYGASGWFPVA